jgi:ribonuclease P protein component
LLKSAQFRRVYDNGFRVSCPFFAAFCLRNQSGEPLPNAGPRIGFTIPRGVGKAVVRNRIRRRLREIFRKRMAKLAPGWEIVLNPRRSVEVALLADLEREVERLIARCAK